MVGHLEVGDTTIRIQIRIMVVAEDDGRTTTQPTVAIEGIRLGSHGKVMVAVVVIITEALLYIES